MKRRRAANEKSQKAELPPALAAFGEQFMSMFDDYDEEQASKQARKAAAVQPSASSSDDESAGASSEAEEEEAAATTAAPSAAAAAAAAAKASRRRRLRNSPPQPASKLETFLSRKKGSSTATGAAPTAAQSKAQQEQQEQQRLLERKLRKQFMSSKVSKIFDEVDVTQLAAAPRDEQQRLEGLTTEEFAQMRRDVELLGASALDKRAAKAWKAATLARLGAAADKAPRTPARIGHGLAKKAKQREAAALQEAIAAGMVKAKGRGKKMRAVKAKQRDRGLQEAGPGFKNGVLRLPKKSKLS